MEGKNIDQINYKLIFINAAITAGVSALVVGLVNKFWKNSGSGLGVPMKLMANLPLERQAQFADIVTIGKIRDSDWLRSQLANIDINDPVTFKHMNRSSIGNCAFVALYAEDPEVKSKCLEILRHLKMYV